MHVRVRSNATGTKTIYLIDSFRVAGKKSSSSRMIRCFGSSDDQSVLDQWIADANILKSQLEKQSFNRNNFIQIKSESDITDCESKTIGVGYFYKSIYEKTFAKLKLTGVNGETLANLVTMRLVQPLSKLRTAKVANDYGIEQLSINKIYKMMDALDDDNIAKIKKYVFNNSKSLLAGQRLRVLFYDLTTIYFEANTTSELKEFGYSKDGKSQHVQISLAMIVTDGGLPLGYEIFKGNSFEGHTLIPTLNKLKEEYKINDITIVADSAMLSNQNIVALEQNGYKYIVAARVKSMDVITTAKLLDHADYIDLNITTANHDKDQNDRLKYKIIDLAKKPKDDNNNKSNSNTIRNLIACYSDSRKRKDEYDRIKTLNRINKIVGKTAKSQLRSALNKPYVDTSVESGSNGTKAQEKGKEAEIIILNEKKLAEATRLEGYFGYITNTTLSPSEVMAQYKGLWQVEQTFRITKHNLEIRPVYHFVDRRIKAHFAICYLSLALLRTVETKLRRANQYVPIEELHAILEKIHQVDLTIGETKCKITTATKTDLVAKIFASLDIALPKHVQLTSI